MARDDWFFGEVRRYGYDRRRGALCVIFCPAKQSVTAPVRTQRNMKNHFRWEAWVMVLLPLAVLVIGLLAAVVVPMLRAMK